MKLSKTSRISIAFVVASLATFAACTFPDVSFAPEGADVDGGNGTSSGSSGAPGIDASGDAARDAGAGVDPDGVHQDAATRDPDSGIVRPEAGAEGGVQGCGAGGGNACDCDNDNVKNSSCPPQPSGGFDCDDFDPLVHPGTGFVAAKWDPTSPHTPQGDWNCDGTVTKQYSFSVSCGLLNDCNGQGFRDNPGCGESGDYVFCKSALLPGVGLACAEDKTKQETRTQGCR